LIELVPVIPGLEVYQHKQSYEDMSLEPETREFAWCAFYNFSCYLGQVGPNKYNN